MILFSPGRARREDRKGEWPRRCAWIVAVCMSLAGTHAAEPARNAAAKIDPWLASKLGAGARASFLVRFGTSEQHRAEVRTAASAPLRPGAVYDALRRRSVSDQSAARLWLRKRGIPYRPLFLINALQVEGDMALAVALAARPEVDRVVGDPEVRGVESAFGETSRRVEAVEWGIAAIRAPLVWASDGSRGEGITVASADTGVEWSHPALIGRYRGWDGTTASHDYNWHDAIADLPTPLDDLNHGTHTTGTMVGDDGAGNQIGVAPGARWIGCRNMDHGFGTPSRYLECMQFFLAPWPAGGDPENDGDPTRSPDIVNNSWTCPPSEGCDPLTLEDGFAALEAAGIFTVSSAGNSGPSCSSVSDPPAIYAETLVVGATDVSGALASFSSRGPVTVDGSGRMRPDLSAPGVSVRSSVRGGGYAFLSGTSMAGPHVAGATALLWSIRPQLRGNVALTRCTLTRSAGPVTVPSAQVCGGTGQSDLPNHLFGWGLIDAFSSVHPQADGDGDGIADACDCAPSDSGAYDAPGEVRRLAVDPDRVTLRWEALSPSAGSGTHYDVIRGGLGDLAAAGSISTAACLGGGLPGQSAVDPDMPGSSEGFYYLVQARNACGAGGWGRDSAGAPRVHYICP